MDSESFQAALARLMSLLEGHITEAKAREALQASSGIVEVAMARLFDGSSGSLLGSQDGTAACDSSTVIDIDMSDGDDGGTTDDALSETLREEAPRKQRKPTPASDGCRAKRRRLKPVPHMPEADSEVLAGRSITEGGSSGSRAWPSQLSAEEIPAQPLPASVEAAFQALGPGWELLCESSQWARINLLDQFSQDWAQRVQAQDPPCLSLQGQKEILGQVSTSSGEMHSASGHSSGKTSLTDQTLQEKVHWLEGGNVAVRTSLLRELFASLLSGVRYPPAELELSWRLVEVDRKSSKKFIPPDLRGPIPSRPFRLLDNSGDAPAEQPPHFQSHSLRPEQRRSLAWMIAREEGEADDAGGRSKDQCVVEWRRFWSPESHEGKEVDQIVVGASVKCREDAQGPFADASTDVLPRPLLELSQLHGAGEVHSRQGANCIVRFARGLEAPLLVTCSLKDLEFVDLGGMHPGCRVMLQPDLKSPAYGWGGINKQMVGVLLKHEGENISVKWPTHCSWKGKFTEIKRADMGPAKDVRLAALDIRVRASYAVRGGILADKIGYGKTATTIALIDRGLGRPLPEIPYVDQGRFIPAKGTLVIVPSNLFEQWLNEIGKFIWNKPLRQSMRAGWSPKSFPMKILAMSNVSPLSKAKAHEVAEADVVICSYRLLYSQIYCQRRDELSRGPCTTASSLSDLSKQTKLLLEGLASMRSGRKSEVQVTDWQALEFPVLEMFYWRRVVFDEFHELESFESLQQNSLQFLRSHFRWGLTGTPPVESNAGGIFMSSLFRIDLPGYLPRPEGKALDLQPWEDDRLLTETVGHFLDAFARQNTADLPHIKLQEQVVLVHHTAAERALYLGQAHDAPEFGSAGAFENEEKVRALERLLKLCSHFQAGGGDNAVNAQEECERISDQKERRVVRARNQIRRCCRVILLLDQKLAEKTSKHKKKPKTWCAELDEAKKQVAAESDAGKLASKELDGEVERASAEDLELRLQILDGHRPKCEELLSLLGPDDQQRGCTQQWAALATDQSWTVANLEKFLRAQAVEQAQNLRELHEASASMDFFRRTVQALAKDGGPPEERSCSVCMEEDLPLAKLAITPCAHTFCLECLKATVEKFSACSICRRQLSSKDVRPIVAEIASPALVAGSSSSSSSEKAQQTGMRFDKYGTKLEVLVQKLRQLRAEDTAAKVILFVQFDDLKRKVSSALHEFGIPCATLQGGVGQRSSIIRDWQHNPQSQTFVLLLSLAQSASGSNLTAASHVIFLHPMLASSAEKAVGYEMQAIGRARRHGQQRSVVHVWRFVTTGTLEQTITEEHQGALWKTEQERQEQRRKLQLHLQEREHNAQQVGQEQAKGAE
eukprot:TRINITY_DN22621_c0_g1_i1.p1 TRINITY_DN22621_c0_g1~~TRINITY_DN22621_c0_g1_i1.p1  ORF type:complete len:1349 (+),score=265.47 TRINITY_DN22621_c0_g1_i1:55-4101(+)